MLKNAKVPILGFAAWSGTGKTTLLRQVLPLLTAQGLRIGMIKHAHHQFDIDKPGKDSYELRKAGAGQMLVTSSNRWALMVEKAVEGDPLLDDMILQLNQDELDLILVEGFRHEAFPKIELHRPSLGKGLLFPDDENIMAVAADDALSIETQLPVLNLNSAQDIADYILKLL